MTTRIQAMTLDGGTCSARPGLAIPGQPGPHSRLSCPLHPRDRNRESRSRPCGPQPDRGAPGITGQALTSAATPPAAAASLRHSPLQIPQAPITQVSTSGSQQSSMPRFSENLPTVTGTAALARASQARAGQQDAETARRPR
jgi:hypothetical protein